MSHVVGGFIQVFLQHACTGLAGGRIVFGQTAVDANLVKGDALSGQGLHHQVVGRPEGLFGKRRRAQSILVGDHHKLKIQPAADEAQVAHHFRIELQFLQSVQLVIHRRLNDQCAVAVDKKYSLLHKMIIYHFPYFLNASNKASFSARVPTVMRRQLPQRVTAWRLRTMMPSPTR